MIDHPRSKVILFLALVSISSVFFYASLIRDSHTRPTHGVGSRVDLPNLSAANSTLGFGAVVAVSRAGSPRRDGLLLAANVTEIDITIPVQPQWADDDIARLHAQIGSRIERGSALAWLGHLNALRWFLNSTTLETIVILEDDVDWDIHLRTVQIPKAAAAIRSLVNSGPSLSNVDDYYGPLNAWDILYLGHCGDIFQPSRWTWRVLRAAYLDTTLPDFSNLHPNTQKFLRSIQIPEKTRIVHQSIFPLCTFGYAVTRSSAARILAIAAREADGGTMAYDVRVLEACRDLGLRCWSVNPELFHHMGMPSEIATVNAGDGTEGREDDLGRVRGQSAAGRTPNIACGARSTEFWTRDGETLKYLQEVVGRQGHCLRDPMEEEIAKAL
ncbi:hypothetical protein LTR50_001334 [Elasticomyces elasticus]|nr:hypothetical protein LTR50_001334 [Elasticomyces elasticus]